MTANRFQTFLNSLRGRLLISHMVIALASLSIAGIAAVSGILPIHRALTYTRMEDSLALAFTAAQTVPRFLERQPGDDGRPGPRPNTTPDSPEQFLNERFNAIFRSQLESQNLRMLLVDLESRRITFDSEATLVGEEWRAGALPKPSRVSSTAPPIVRAGRSDIQRSRVRLDGGTWLYTAANLGRTDTESTALILLTPSSTLGSAAIYMRTVLPTPLILVILSAIFVVIWLMSAGFTRSLTRNLQPVLTGTEEIAAGNLNYRVADAASSLAEVTALGHSFNRMAEEVQASRQAQRDFVANVGHDLKTPLTSIQGFTQALLDGTAATPQVQERAAHIIYDESQRLGRLVDELLDVARLDNDSLQLQRQLLQVDDFLIQVTEPYLPRCQAAGVALVLAPLPEPFQIHGDPDRLQRIFGNLLDNALAYTPGGGTIRLTAQRVAQAESGTGQSGTGQSGTGQSGTGRSGTGQSNTGNMIEIAVTDTGSGIPSADLGHIFERFYRVEKSRSGRGSSGLGLAIVQELVHAHGGSVGVESQPEQGSRFWVRLPLVG